MALRKGRKYTARHMANYISNEKEVRRLLEIHAEVAGASVGRKYRVEVLNKSGIVLLVACWEAYVEDLANGAFDVVVRNARDPSIFTGKVLTLASQDLRNSQDQRKVWELAGTGWKDVLRKHHDKILNRFTGNLNTPKPDQIDQLFEALVGMRKVSRRWSWSHMSPERARKRLSELVKLRGAIAHRVTAATSVRKKNVDAFSAFVTRLAVVTHNAVLGYLHKRLGFTPWHPYEVCRGPAGQEIKQR